MKITFHGAGQEVTGSKHLIEYNDQKILLDCGMFQGRRSEAREKNKNFKFDPKTIDAVVLSHGHLDHCGLLPLLVKQGYKGKIYATPATKDIAHKILLDSANIQESDFRYLKKCGDKNCDKLAKPLYTKNDIPAVMRRFVTQDYVRNKASWVKILPDVRLKFYDAGHILGSAVSLLEFKVRGRLGRTNFRIGYTGDLGKRNAPLLHNPHYIKERVDVMISEATYGGKKHGDVEEAQTKLVKVVERIIKTKGKLIIPAFSLGRTQEVVYLIHHLVDTGRLSRIPIYVDSPLATRITQVFKKYRKDYDIESRLDFPRQGDVPLAFRNLIYTKDRNESMALNHKKGPFAVISASGMAEGGRVLHHLKNSLRSANNTILFTGYQARHTLGRKLLNGESRVRVYGRPYHVNAKIEMLPELSAHADGPELASYILHCKGVKKVFLTHSEPEKSRALKKLLLTKRPKLEVIAPKLDQSFEL